VRQERCAATPGVDGRTWTKDNFALQRVVGTPHALAATRAAERYAGVSSPFPLVSLPQRCFQGGRACVCGVSLCLCASLCPATFCATPSAAFILLCLFIILSVVKLTTIIMKAMTCPSLPYRRICWCQYRGCAARSAHALPAHICLTACTFKRARRCALGDSFAAALACLRTTPTAGIWFRVPRGVLTRWLPGGTEGQYMPSTTLLYAGHSTFPQQPFSPQSLTTHLAHTLPCHPPPNTLLCPYTLPLPPLTATLLLQLPQAHVCQPLASQFEHLSSTPCVAHCGLCCPWVACEHSLPVGRQGHGTLPASPPAVSPAAWRNAIAVLMRV